MVTTLKTQKDLHSNFIILMALFIFTGSAAQSITLSPKDVAELVLKQSSRTQEINNKYQLLRLQPATILGQFDWKLTLASGLESDKLATFQTSDAKYDRFITTMNLAKPLTTGTLLGIDYSRVSQKADFSTTSSISSSTPPEATLDVLSISVEQALLWNAFGNADQSTIHAAELTYKASSLLRADELQNLVLETLNQYWNTYVSQENFKESMASKERYKTLVDTVRRKNSYGYSNPGELTQVQAELEGREQAVRTASINYLANLDNFLLLLNLEPSTKIDFSIPASLPVAPNLGMKDHLTLRQVRSQKMKVQAAEENYSSSDSKSLPALNLVGKISTSGADTSPEGSYSKLASGANPKYYLGLKFVYNFGSDTQTEDMINKKVSLKIEEIKLSRQLQDVQNKEAQAMRKVQANFGIAESSSKQKELREKTVNELTRSYNQGRTDLRTLIDALNAYFNSQVQYTRAVGDYQISLNEWAAIRDELIPDSPTTKGEL